MPTRPPMLRINSERDGSNYYLRLTGELDFSNVRLLEGELDRLEESDAEHLVVDLGGLEFIDPNGMASLIRASQRSAQDSNRLRMKRSDHRAVNRMLGLARIESSLPFD
jgi:anti-sigma B factor antagonist